jgi:hypothetical protein
MVGFDGFEEETTGPSTNRKLGIRGCGRKQKNGGHPATRGKKGRNALFGSVLLPTTMK